jgi:phage gp37-like protein
VTSAIGSGMGSAPVGASGQWPWQQRAPLLRARVREEENRVVKAQRLTGGPHRFEIQMNSKIKTCSNLLRSKTNIPGLKKFE